MSKKMLKRSLALGALMAFVITGSAMAAEEIYVGSDTTSLVFDKNVQNGVDLTDYIVNENTVSTGEAQARIYGINVDAGSHAITLKNVSKITINADSEQARSVRLNAKGASFSAEQSLTLNATTNTGQFAVGLGAYSGNTLTFNDLNIVATNNNTNNKTGWLDARALALDAEGGSTVIVNGVADITAQGNAFTQAVYSSGSQIVFNNNANITATSTRNSDGSGSDARAINLEDWIGNKNINKLTFNGDATSITATADSGNALGAMASGGSVKIDFTDSDVDITVTAKEEAIGFFAKMGSEAIATGDVNIKSTSTDGGAYGIHDEAYSDTNGYVSVASKIEFSGTTTIEAMAKNTAYGVCGEGGADIDLADTTITATSTDGSAYGIYADASNVDVVGDLTVNATGGLVGRGVEAREGSKITLGNENKTNDINITAKGSKAGDVVAGIVARHDESEVKVYANELNVTATATGNAWAYGVNANTTTTAGVANFILDANKTVITATSEKEGQASAIVAMSGSGVSIEGDLVATGDNVILTRGNAKTEINKSGKGTVNLNGDIKFDASAGAVIDATVDISLSNAQSYLKGNIYALNNRENEVTGMKLNLSNGAQWELSEASVVNQATFGENTVLVLKDGSVFEAKADASQNVYALNAGGGNENSLTVDSTAKLQIGNIKETTYNIAQGFESYDKVAESIDIVDNALLQANKIVSDANKTYQVKIEAKEASQMAADTGISTSTAELVQSIIEGAGNENKTPEQEAAVEFINNVIANNATDAAVGNAINSATKMAEAGGNSATAANIVKNVTGVTNDRLSFNCGHSAPHKGGHGVGLFEEGSGADIWVEYVHGKDKVEDMPSTAGATSYEGQYNGFVMGVDFKRVNKFQSGIAFNYGEGDTNSIGGVARTHSDYDFWGVGYYGNIHNDDSNVIFDINYAKTDSDVTQENSGSTFEASPETTTWSAGVKVEKLYQNENVQIVPYTGLRYMSIDSDDYSTKCGAFNYSMDRQDIWLLPLGVSIKQEVTNDNGWTVSPRVDLSYIWAFGDTNSNMEVKSPFAGVSQLGYDVMDDGSFLGLVGIEAHKGQWGFGVSYSYQKGDHSESKKWYVDANYSF